MAQQEQPSDDYPVEEVVEPSLDGKRSELKQEARERDWKNAGKILSGLLVLNDLLNVGIKKAGPGPGWGDLIKKY